MYARPNFFFILHNSDKLRGFAQISGHIEINTDSQQEA